MMNNYIDKTTIVDILGGSTVTAWTVADLLYQLIHLIIFIYYNEHERGYVKDTVAFILSALL